VIKLAQSCKSVAENRSNYKLSKSQIRYIRTLYASRTCLTSWFHVIEITLKINKMHILYVFVSVASVKASLRTVRDVSRIKASVRFAWITGTGGFMLKPGAATPKISA
jgi:hypothetical protein